MANLSSFLTTSFHTQLSFLDADSEENLLEEDEEEEEEEESFGPSGIPTDSHTAALEIICRQKVYQYLAEKTSLDNWCWIKVGFC